MELKKILKNTTKQTDRVCMCKKESEREREKKRVIEKKKSCIYNLTKKERLFKS